jgi:hypothetical protein
MPVRWSLVFALLLAGCGRSPPVRYLDLPKEEAPSNPTPSPPGNAWALPLPPPPPPPICEAVDADRLPLPPRVKRPIDVLFVIDDSCSMEDDQRALAENFDSFFQAFRQKDVDFHLGAVTTDMNDPLRSGRLVAPFLTPATPDIDLRFSEMVRVGTQGSTLERGLLAAWSALREPNRSGANRGFWRSEADFALVFLGDEDDQSSIDIADFGDFLEAEKKDTDVTVGTIVVGACRPETVAHWRLVQFARRFATRGVTRLCTSDYADTLRSIAGRIVDARCTVALRRKLGEMNPITVTVNGLPATFREDPPDEAFPFGSIEVSPCPEAGGFVDIVYEDCFFPAP